MKLAYEAELAADLERGLGEVHWGTINVDPSLRLRMPVCGLTSLALAQVMNERGMTASAIESTPDLLGEPDTKHEMVRVELGGKTVIIDPTYSQFLDMAGLPTGYVTFGGEDLFPRHKIAVFGIDEGVDVARQLARSVVFFRTQRQPIEELEFSTYVYDHLSYDELVEQWQKIWDPEQYVPFEPLHPEDLKAATRLAQYIVPEHVRLVD